MTPEQLRQARANGLSERVIDDQEREDEAFARIARQPVPIQPHFLRCLGHRNWDTLAAPCQHCRRLTTTIGANDATSRAPDFVAGVCAVRLQA